MDEYQKEINRRKTNRRTATLNLVAKRMGHRSWSTFGKKFRERLYTLEENGTEAEINAAIMGVLADSLSAIKA